MGGNVGKERVGAEIKLNPVRMPSAEQVSGLLEEYESVFVDADIPDEDASRHARAQGKRDVLKRVLQMLG
ncbi:MAG: hypothetical protein UU34_C0002G0046 [Candidatus Curtissbacteria bacterium GW2011_GWA1_41_11]|uniref:Uncharacterized protein n=1 Tax=Candidatus Curtissbacteria bacterium GW2011_GWA1_41_11 TaxID=1618409 RepID=A0A0G0UGC0_9BACT|nr:MAG: hypothetical protein UU34_C0002G0046 [Candidatus Curtissbacteria bacterium GW2011_GWA1_41_11]